MSKLKEAQIIYRELFDFLRPYEVYWSREVIDQYPLTYQQYPTEWINLLETLSPQQLEEIDGKYIEEFSPSHPLAGTELGQLFTNLWQLEKKYTPPLFLEEDSLLKINKEDFLHVKPKKKHELLKLLAPLQEFFKQCHFESIMDLAGGVGHLSRIIAKYLAPPKAQVFCLDLNQSFQDSGHRKGLKSGPIPFQFINHDIKKFDTLPLLKKTVSVGLHTCGDLAVCHLKLIEENKMNGVFNVGCCYQHLSLSNVYLSTMAQELKFPWTLYALTLASKAHRRNKNDPKHTQSFKDKWQVKNYRCALQMILHKNNRNDITSVGETKIENYYGPFNQYAVNKLLALKIPCEDLQSLQNFYEEEKTQQELKKLFLCNIIRWQFGRTLELMIIYDRLIWALENNLKVQSFTLFDELISPRNIAIYVIK